MPILYNPNKEPTILSEYDVRQILEATHKPYFKPFIMLELNTGMGMQEQLNIRFRDIEIGTGRILLPSRTVMAPLSIMGLLKPFYNIPNSKPDDYFFPFSEYDVNQYIKHWNKSLKKKFSWIDLRHTYASTAAKQGISIAIAANNIGTEIKNLKKYYGDITVSNGHAPEALFV